MTKIAVFGAGAIGGVLAARLALAGHKVTVFARGDHAAAMRDHGLLFETATGTQTVSVTVGANAQEFGVQDLVIIGVKAPSLTAASLDIAPLIGPETLIVPTLNGLPWWYHFDGDRADFKTIDSLDPDNAISKNIPAPNIIGATVNFAATSPAPGLVKLATDGHLVLGEPNNQQTKRLKELADLFNNAGIQAKTTDNIRVAIWQKLWGNLAYNPVSALTHTTFADINASDNLFKLVRSMMMEAENVAQSVSITMPVTLEDRIDQIRRLGAFKSSMLQDVEKGRRIEIEALLGAVIEIGHANGVDVHHLEVVFGLLEARFAHLQ